MVAWWVGPLISAVASSSASAATGVKGPTAQPGQASAGGARQQLEQLYSAGDIMSQMASMKKDATMGGPLTASRAPAVSSGSGGAQANAGSNMQSFTKPFAPQGAGGGMMGDGMPSGAGPYSAPQGSGMMGGGAGAGPQSIRAPMQAPTPAPTPTLGPTPAAPGPTPPTTTPTTPQGPPTSTTGGGGGAAGYAAIAAALANAASNVRGESVQAPGFSPGTVSGLRPSATQGSTVQRGGGSMDMNQLIRMLSSQGRGRRRF